MLIPQAPKAQRSLSSQIRCGTEGLGYGKPLRLRLLATWIILLITCLSGPLAQAQEALWEQHLAPNDLVPNQLAPTNTPNVSVERAIRIVRRQTGGRVLAASASSRKGHPGVNVRTLLDGERVATFFVHADGRLQKR